MNICGRKDDGITLEDFAATEFGKIFPDRQLNQCMKILANVSGMTLSQSSALKLGTGSVLEPENFHTLMRLSVREDFKERRK
jgi:hypothetical protein